MAAWCIGNIIGHINDVAVSGPVSTGMGDHLQRAYHPGIFTSHLGQRTSYPLRDGKWVPANGRWYSVAGKVTVGLASHWSCVTDFSGLSTYELTWLKKGRWAPHLHSSWPLGYGTLHNMHCQTVTHNKVIKYQLLVRWTQFIITIGSSLWCHCVGEGLTSLQRSTVNANQCRQEFISQSLFEVFNSLLENNK